MFRRLVGMLLALAVLGGASVAFASRGKTPLRTAEQADLYLTRGLRRWSHIDLVRVKSKAAFCVSAGQEMGRAQGATRFRSFECTLYASFRNRSHVFGLDLLTTRSGWRALAEKHPQRRP
jgi:hypothetical protein